MFAARSTIPFLICCFFFCAWSCLAVLDGAGGGGILGGGNRAAGPAGNLGGPAILGGPGIRGGKPGSGNPGPGGVGGIAGRIGGPYLNSPSVGLTPFKRVALIISLRRVVLARETGFVFVIFIVLAIVTFHTLREIKRQLIYTHIYIYKLCSNNTALVNYYYYYSFNCIDYKALFTRRHHVNAQCQMESFTRGDGLHSNSR